MDRGLARIVSRQGGVLTREQALGSCTPAEVRARLRRGTWRRTPWRGVYVDGELPDDPRTVVRAAALWLGGDLVACHSTAALLWGFDLRSASAVAAGDLHFIAPDAVDNRRLERLWVHPSSLGTDDAVLRHGVWCTSPGRIACDVARLGAPVDALATLDAALRSRHCTPEDFHRAPPATWAAWGGTARRSPAARLRAGRIPDGVPDALALPGRRPPCAGGAGRGGRSGAQTPARHGLGGPPAGRRVRRARSAHDASATGRRPGPAQLAHRARVAPAALHAVHVYRRHGEMVRMVDRQLRARRPAIMAP